MTTTIAPRPRDSPSSTASLIAQTRPGAIQQAIDADRIRLEQMTDAEVIDALPTFRAVHSEKQLELVELWENGLTGQIRAAEEERIRRYLRTLRTDELKALYERRSR